MTDSADKTPAPVMSSLLVRIGAGTWVRVDDVQSVVAYSGSPESDHKSRVHVTTSRIVISWSFDEIDEAVKLADQIGYQFGSLGQKPVNQQLRTELQSLTLETNTHDGLVVDRRCGTCRDFVRSPPLRGSAGDVNPWGLCHWPERRACAAIPPLRMSEWLGTDCCAWVVSTGDGNGTDGKQG